jgi:hypothetical protein
MPAYLDLRSLARAADYGQCRAYRRSALAHVLHTQSPGGHVRSVKTLPVVGYSQEERSAPGLGIRLLIEGRL